MDAGVEEVEGGAEQSAADDDDGGGSIARDDILGAGELDKHFGGRVLDVDLFEDGGAVVGDKDFSGGGLNHFVHAAGAE